MKPVASRPSTTARGISFATLGAAPFVAVYLWVSAAVNVRPTTGETLIDYRVTTVGDAGYPADLATDPGAEATVTGGRTLTLSLFDADIDRAYYLWGDLLHLLALGVVVLAVTVAVGVLRGRPASRATVGVLAGLSVFSAVSAWAGPRAKEWAAVTAAERTGLPWGTTEAEAAGADAFVVGDLGLDWWWASMVVVTLVCAGAALWVLHVRRRLVTNQGR